MKFPSPAFDDAVAAACHGTADDACLAALAAVLQTDEAALDAYLWQTELHATLLTSTQFVEPPEIVLLGQAIAAGGSEAASQPRALPAPRRLVVAAWIGAMTLGLLLAGWLGASLWDGMGDLRGRPADASAKASPQVAAVIGSFDRLEEVEWVAAETNIRAGDPLRCGQRIELARGSVGLEFSSGASVRLTGPVIFEAESPMTAILTMGRVAVTADTPESKGFTIRTRTGRIVDLGTEFTAEALPDGRCRIGVSSGAVSFHPGERGAGHLLRAGDLMEVEPGQRQVITRIERGDESSAFRFPSIEPPTPDDFADRSRGQASIRSVLGRLYSNLPKAASAAPEILLDGRGQRTPDAPPESLYFADNETGGLMIDLGVAVPVTKINVYSWHSCMNPGFPDDLRQAHRERAAQNYVLYGHPGDEPPGVAADPADSGWTLIARVNSDAYFGLTGIARPPQQASSISSARGTLGKFRHLLVIVQPTTGIDNDGTQQNFSTFFGEIDVYAEP
jgi:hypothetical protein